MAVNLLEFARLSPLATPMEYLKDFAHGVILQPCSSRCKRYGAQIVSGSLNVASRLCSHDVVSMALATEARPVGLYHSPNRQ